MYRSATKICLFFSIIAAVDCARILGVIPTPSFSHQVVARPLWRELSLRGHAVTVITTDPIKDPSLTNLTEIDLHFTYKTWRKRIGHIVRNFGRRQNVDYMKAVYDLYGVVFHEELSRPEVQNLIRNKTEKFDLVIAEYTQPIVFVFAKIFNCPLIGIGSMDATSSVYRSLGSPTHPILYPDLFAPSLGDGGFFGRLFNVRHDFLVKYVLSYYVKRVVDPIAAKYFGIDYSPYEIARNTSVILVSKSPIFLSVRPVVPAVVYIGGGTHFMEPHPLQKVKDKGSKIQRCIVFHTLYEPEAPLLQQLNISILSPPESGFMRICSIVKSLKK